MHRLQIIGTQHQNDQIERHMCRQGNRQRLGPVPACSPRIIVTAGGATAHTVRMNARTVQPRPKHARPLPALGMAQAGDRIGAGPR